LGTINHTATSSDTDYNGLTVDSVTANITDNDSAEIEVELEQGEITIETNGEMSQSLTLSNTSDMPLDWQAFTEEAAVRLVLGGTCEENNNDAQWVMLNPTSGTIPPAESQQSEVTVDATGLDAGDYQANICISVSEIDTMISIPVSLTVTEPTAVEMAELNANMPPLGLLAAGMLLLLAGGYVTLSHRR
jgi:hypothetical protein